MSSYHTETTKAQKIGAWYLLINSSFIIMSFFLGLEDNSQLTRTFTSIIIDSAIGISILLNKDRWIVYAKIRVIGGLILFAIQAIMSKDYITLFVQVLLSLTMILVLFGDAGKIRIRLSIIFFNFICLLYSLGILSAYTGFSLIDGLYLSKAYSLIDRDENHPYDLSSLSKNWKMRTMDSYSLENQYVDIWMVQPFYDAHIMIIHEKSDYIYDIEHQTFVDNVVENAKAAGDADVWREERDIYKGYDRTKMEVRSVVDEIPFAYFYSIMSDDTDIIQIICFTYEEQYKYVEEEFENFANGFSLK